MSSNAKSPSAEPLGEGSRRGVRAASVVSLSDAGAVSAVGGTFDTSRLEVQLLGCKSATPDEELGAQEATSRALRAASILALWSVMLTSAASASAREKSHEFHRLDIVPLQADAPTDDYAVQWRRGATRGGLRGDVWRSLATNATAAVRGGGRRIPRLERPEPTDPSE